MANNGLLQDSSTQDLVMNRLQQRLDEQDQIRKQMKSPPQSDDTRTVPQQPGVNPLEPPIDDSDHYKMSPNRRLPRALVSNNSDDETMS